MKTEILHTTITLQNSVLNVQYSIFPSHPEGTPEGPCLFIAGCPNPQPFSACPAFAGRQAAKAGLSPKLTGKDALVNKRIAKAIEVMVTASVLTVMAVMIGIFVIIEL